MKKDQAQYTEIGRDTNGQQYQLTGTITRDAIPALVATGTVPDGAVTTDE